MRLPSTGGCVFDKTGCIPESFHPQRKVAHDGRLVGRFNAGAVKIMKQVNREPLGREHTSVALHAGHAAPGTVERNDRRNGAVSCRRQVGVEADRLAAALENCRRLCDGRHLRIRYAFGDLVALSKTRQSVIPPPASFAPTANSAKPLRPSPPGSATYSNSPASPAQRQSRPPARPAPA